MFLSDHDWQTYSILALSSMLHRSPHAAGLRNPRQRGKRVLRALGVSELDPSAPPQRGQNHHVYTEKSTSEPALEYQRLSRHVQMPHGYVGIYFVAEMHYCKSDLRQKNATKSPLSA
jgi:hypothetical protein